MPPTQKNRLLAISTALGDDGLLIKDFSISEQLGRMFQIEVELMSDDTAVDFDKIVGSNATIRLQMAGEEPRYFNGFVSRFVQGESKGKFARYRATLVPWLWFLTRTADCRIFQKKKVPDIIEAVFKAHEFKDFKLKLSGTYREWEYCVQYRETDFNFVSRLMEQEGIYYYFTHENGLHTLVLADGAAAHEPFPGYETMIYRPPSSHQKEQSESVSDWVMEKEVQPGVYALADFNFQTTVAPILSNANINRTHPAAAYEIFDYPGEFKDRAEGDAYAKVRIEELQAQHETLRAQTTVRGASVGSKFKLKDHPREDQNDRDCLITAVTCHASVGDYESGGASEPFFSCNFTAMPASEPFRSPRLTPKPTIQGPQTAIVVGKKGEEIDTDEFGRVKVQFHWDRYGKVDENSSCWVRVSQMGWAGDKWGGIHIPRMGQEVIVEFLEGDPDRPIVTGRVYNAKSVVPYDLPANKTQSGLKSRSTKGGTDANFNEIRFEDKKGEEELYIHAEKDQVIEVENDETHSVGNNREKTIGADETTIVKGNRTETVSKDEEISIEGNRSEEVKKDASLAVSGKRSHSVTKDETVDVQGKRTKTVGKDEEVTITGNQMTTVEKDSTLKVTGQMTVTIDKKYTAKVTDSIAIQGDKDILIECGSAKVLLKKDGKVQIEGSDVNIKASGKVKIKGSSVAVN